MGVILGIDPGLHGGLAALDESGTMSAWATPTAIPKKGERAVFDEVAMRDLLAARPAAFAVIERVAAMPGQGVTSMFRFGEGYGLWKGLLIGLGIPYVAVVPRVWKPALFPTQGLDRPAQKQAAVEFILAAYPGLDLVRPRGRKPHDGMADAACLAHYGYLISMY